MAGHGHLALSDGYCLAEPPQLYGMYKLTTIMFYFGKDQIEVYISVVYTSSLTILSKNLCGNLFMH